MKTCTKCHKTKSLEEFSRDRTKKDSRRPDCKECDGKQSLQYYLKNRDKCLQRTREYNQTDAFKLSQKKYMRTKKGKITQAASHKRSHARYPEKLKAKSAVSIAVENGKIPKIKTHQCYRCPNSAEHYHHHKGYAREHWLDVVPVCMGCHREIHKIKGVKDDTEL